MTRTGCGNEALQGLALDEYGREWAIALARRNHNSARCGRLSLTEDDRCLEQAVEHRLRRPRVLTATVDLP